MLSAFRLVRSPKITLSLHKGCTIVPSRLLSSNSTDYLSKKDVAAGTLMNDVVFDTLIRKPYEKQIYNYKHISNAKFVEIIAKHGIMDTSLVVCSILGACALCSQFGFISPSLLHLFNDGGSMLNRFLPFLYSISGDSMRHTFQLMAVLSPAWIAGSVALSWLGCRRELRKVYDEYEKENEMLFVEEKPGFIQSCSLEDGCSMRFYGDECQHGNGRKFTKRSTKQSFYNGYGGDCSFKKTCAMRVVLQRVLSASVSVDGEVISKIGKGIMCLVGIRDNDDRACAEVMTKKLLDVKLWEDDKGRPWSKNVKDMGYEVLLVSQFTLFGSVRQKPKPDYHRSMGADDARVFFNNFVEHVKKTYKDENVKTGEFQAYMNVELQNDGPVTLILDTDEYDGAVDYVRKQIEKAEKCKVSEYVMIKMCTSLTKLKDLLQQRVNLKNIMFS